ncbi:succinylglutamate desuccinylase/aspartoacylase family protein [Caballeronia insecticola]|uniref:Succinylglutamate desuccinylase/aspartoacylase n=1 Tax=Caballeronia insecticola TaxID=758793 RepID=R4X1M2_9BURK|nr:succinylglutamate desuccinylase/aspartoacylase family protein [Caballeronia insecticola]BAN26216.1 succinylglutamate desuccinylase/aspartoacylase [Caballeronia insecticola]
MSTSASLIATDIDYERAGFQTGTLRLPYSHDRSAYGHIPIPLAVLNAGDGPTVLLTGGNHGDEYEGPVALMKLMQRLPTLAIRGRLIVIPALNFPAFLNGTRTSPIDSGNLNRLFPGARHGKPTEMIAHYVETELLPRADIVFDFHAGGASFDHAPTLLASPPPASDPARRARYLDLMRAFGAPNTMVMDLLGEDRTFAAAAERHGTLFLCGEFGGHAGCDAGNLAIVERGLQRVLQQLGVVPDEDLAAPPRTRTLRVEGARHYVYAPHAGVFEPAFSLDDDVRAGQLAGRLFDPHEPWRAPREIAFGGDGRVMCARTFARVEAGDCIALLAAETSLD